MRKLGKPEIDAVAEYIRTNATIMKNKSGKEFIGLDGFRHDVAGLNGQLRFGFFGLSEASETSENATKRAKEQVNKLSPEARQALLAELLDEPSV
jgi:hypothetical protein